MPEKAEKNAAQQPAGKTSKTLRQFLDIIGPLVGLVLVITVFTILEPELFLTFGNFATVAGQVMVVAMAAIGMTFVIVSGGIDLSAGSLVALTGVTGTLALSATGSVTVAVLVAVATGMFCGVLNGTMITTMRLPPFIVTLGTLEIFRGTALYITGGMQVTGLPDHFQDIAEESLVIQLFGYGISVQYAIIFLIFFAFVAWILLRKTVFGVCVYAIGSNEQTARLCGIRVNLVKVAVYGFGGLATGLAGILQASRLITGQPSTAVGMELEVIAAVVIGGGSLLGGEGTILGTLIGALIMGFLKTGCDLHGISPFVQRIVIGSIIILAVFVDLWRQRTMSGRQS